MIIGISGYARAGKDTLGKMLIELFNKDNSIEPFQIKKMSLKLKQIAGILLNVDPDVFEYQTVKEVSFSEDLYSGMSIRDFLQKLGTEAIRNNLHPDTWINGLLSEYYSLGLMKDELTAGINYNKSKDKSNPNIIVTDVRYKNEADKIRELGGIIIRINRKDIGPINAHPSETALDDYAFDYVLENDEDETALKDKALLLHKNILIDHETKIRNKKDTD